MRPGALAAVAVVAALLGGVATLVVGKSLGWIDDDAPATARPVVVSPSDGSGDAAGVAERGSRSPSGESFEPAELYEQRAAGVVTILAVFPAHDPATGEEAQGSGFVVSPDGYILTNSHVVTTAGEADAGEKPETAQTVYVQYRDDERVPARIVGWDSYDDVAVLKVDPADHPVSPVPLGDSSDVVVGEPVAAIGSPFGQDSSLSVGVVSATERSIDSLTSGYQLVDAIQTDAPINRGNSGGPMFNARGEVIGINAQIRSDTGNAEGVGFAVPINAAKRSLTQLIETGEVSYAWLGVWTQTVTPRVAERFDYGADRGAAIQEVVEASPAARAGLQGGRDEVEGGRDEVEFEGVPYQPGGDLVVAVDGKPVTSSEDVVRAVTEHLPGERTRLTIVRDGRRLTVSVVLGERPSAPPPSAPPETDR